MTILGNIFLVVAALISAFFLAAFRQDDGNQSGNSHGGYAFGVMAFTLLFAACMLVVTIALLAKGGYDWVSANTAKRNFWVVLGFLAVMVVMGMSAMFKYESRVPLADRFRESMQQTHTLLDRWLKAHSL